MSILNKYKFILLGFLLLSILYFGLRLIHFNSLPLFTDEAIYLRWAQIALNDPNWRFISLTDGKQPMLVWAAMIFMNFIQDPLLAGRLVSVATGFFTMIGLWFLTFELFKSKRVAFFSSLLYIFYPFAQVYDRMGLYDSTVAAFFVWATYFSIRLVRRINLDSAYTLGFVIGGGILTKSANFFSIYLLPFTVVLLDFKSKHFKRNFLRWVVLVIFAVLLSQFFYAILRLSPLYHMIEAKNAIFVYPFSEWINHPTEFFFGNFYGLTDWAINYLKIPYLFLIAVSLIFIKKFPREKILLILYFILPFTALALFGRVIFPRFIFFMTLSLLPLAAWGLGQVIELADRELVKSKININKNYLAGIIVALFVSFPFYVSYQVALNPAHADIPKADRSQYVNSWAAGWGVKESVDFFKEKAKDEKIYIATEGTFGLLPFALEMYLVQDKNVTIKGFWPIEDTLPKEVTESANSNPTYFVFYQEDNRDIPDSFPLELLFQVKQGESEYYYRVYQVIPQR